MNAYQELEQRFKRLALLEDVSGILHWDNAVMLADGAAETRSEQLALLSMLKHQHITDPAYEALLDEADTLHLDEWQQVNLQLMRHHWLHEMCLDGSLVEAFSRATSESEHVWRKARVENDFASFVPYLKRVLALVQEMAQAKAAVLGCSEYDALLDSYDPGTRSVLIDALFDDLAGFLPDAIEQSLAARKPVTLDLACSQEQQEALGRRLMEVLGFDFSRGRVDTSTHPFCGGAQGDVRLTTRYNLSDLSEGMYGVLHETGHALYEMGLPKEWRYQPVGAAHGMSVHESQSLFIEMQVSRSRPFAEFVTPIINELCGKSLDVEEVYAHVTQVSRGFIRVNADEVTYPTHVILRYRLEKALLSGDLPVDDLPGAWADMQQELLGVKPKTDTEGCLQDIHWPEGALGYFPTYTLGALIAAQLMEAMRGSISQLDDQIALGEFGPMKTWLGEHVHGKASRYGMAELVEQATGKSLSTDAYQCHIRERYIL